MKKIWGPLAALLWFLVVSGAPTSPQSLENPPPLSDNPIPLQAEDPEGKATLYFPDYVDGGGWSVQLVLSNVDPDATAGVRIEVYDPVGQPVLDLFDSALKLEIPALGSRVLNSAGSGTIRRGWIQVQTKAAVVSGLLTYRHAQSGIEVGVKPVELANRFALFVEESPTVGAGVAVFKPEASPSIELRVRDEEGADPLEGGFVSRGDFHQAARTLPEWFAAEGIDTGFLRGFRGLLFLETEDDSPFAPLGLRFGKGTPSLSAVPAIRNPSQDPQAMPLYFPDYVDGGGWSVQLALSNMDAVETAEVEVEAYDQAGRPVPDLFGSGSRFKIPSLGSRVLKSTGRGEIQRGWIRIRIRTEAAPVSGLLTYRHAQSGVEVSVEPVQLGHEFALFVEESGTIGAGLALFKPDMSSRIKLRLRDEGGNDPLDGVYVPRKDFHQAALTLPEWFDVPGVDAGFLREFRGLLFLWTEDESGFAPVGLRFGKKTSSLSAVPVIRITEGSGIDGRPPPPPTVTLSISSKSIDQGQSVTLSWMSTNAESAEIEPGLGVVPTSGSQTVSPNFTTTYRITVTAADGQTATASVTVTVAGAAPAYVVVTPSEVILPVGDTVRLMAEVWDANGAPVKDAVVAWSSSDEAVAVVDPAGLVRAASSGAATFTATTEEVSGHARVTVVERSDRGALVSLYRSTGGTEWVNSTNWLTDAPLGDWYGVTVDQTGRVVRLELDANNLAGPIPPQIAHLTRLRRLTLADNSLNGRIPPEIGELSLLDFLLLSRNILSGEIPPEIGKLTAMLTMGMSGNRLNGRIPPEIGRLTRLSWLDLGSNDLTGEIPATLAISGLQTLIVAGNHLRGPVPSDFLRSGLQWLEMSFPRHRNLYLCLPGTAAFVAWAARSVDHDPQYCNDSDRAALAALHQATGGAGWTNSGRWLADPAVGEWFGVESDSLGRVVALDLTNNGLSGELPARLGHLTELTKLKIGDNLLRGRLPTSLTALSLHELRYSGTGLCTPGDLSFRAWLNTVPAHRGTEVECAPLSDRDILAILYRATGGPNWRRRDNWMTNAPLEEWYGVDVDAEGRVMSLNLPGNNLQGIIPPELGQLARLEDLQLFENPLKGPIPPELGSLSNLRQLYLMFTQLTGTIPPELGNLRALEELWLERIPLTGPIPSELGRLSELRFLAASESNLSGPIPPELGRLANLEKLYLFGNRLAGSIPQAFGGLTRLNTLALAENDLVGSIPPELGNLDRLEYAWLDGNKLTGPVPMELGGFASAKILALANNDLSGGLPATLDRLSRLEFLMLSNNPRMSGVVPRSLVALGKLKTFHAGGTRLCAPADLEFQAWLATVTDRRVSRCSTLKRSKAYLIQAAQSADFPVPLVADEPALLRVFVTVPAVTRARIPTVRARFYHGGAEAYVTEIPGGSSAIPVEIEEGRLSKSANATIPASVIRPGLEMVIEIDPHNTLPPELGVQRRIPETGRAAVEVVRVPALRLTWIPMISSEQPDSSILTTTRGLTAESSLFRETRTLLPIGEFELAVHDVVWTTTRDTDELLGQVEAIRVMEGGRGYYMGSMANLTGAAGVAHTPGRSSAVAPYGGTIAHELGHNLSLLHAPCGNPGGLDPYFPTANASIGIWGYDDRSGRLIPASHKDLMSYCDPLWISDYSFAKALFYRVSTAASGGMSSLVAAPARSLLLWGGVDARGEPFLEPAFVVGSPPSLPGAAGEYEIVGRTAEGDELFSLSFQMPEVADGDGRSSFAYVLPAQPEWADQLAGITLSGPGGSVTLDQDTNRPVTILRNPRTGQIRAILRGAEAAVQNVEATASALFSDPGIERLTSRGVPDYEDWTQ